MFYKPFWFFTLIRGILFYVNENNYPEVWMNTTQNVTLAIPKDILRKAKILAVQKNTSLSGLLTQTLAELVAREEGYEQARQRNLEMLKSGFDLGTQGKMSWKREGLHER
jgi:hypothetical protein